MAISWTSTKRDTNAISFFYADSKLTRNIYLNLFLSIISKNLSKRSTWGTQILSELIFMHIDINTAAKKINTQTRSSLAFKVAPYSFNSIYTWKGWRTKNQVFVSTLGLSSWHSQWRLATHLGFHFRSYEYIADCCHGNKQSQR